MIIKKCKKCARNLEVTMFYAHKAMGDGRLSFCKDCVKERIRQYWKDGRGYEYDKKRQLTEKRRHWQRLYTKIQKKKWHEKVRARELFWTRFSAGKIEKTNCIVCGTPKNVEAHHSDYNKPYDVMWLCSLHHKEWHRNNKAILAGQLKNPSP